MGKRGPAPTPTKVLEARGSHRAKGREGEVSFPVEQPRCPAWLSRGAKAVWRRVAPQLEAAGVLARVDGELLAVYCETCAEFAQLGKLIAALCKDKDGYEQAVAKGLVNARNKAADRMAKLADRFGLSPAARPGVKAPGQAPANDGTILGFARKRG